MQRVNCVYFWCDFLLAVFANVISMILFQQLYEEREGEGGEREREREREKQKVENN